MFRRSALKGVCAALALGAMSLFGSAMTGAGQVQADEVPEIVEMVMGSADAPVEVIEYASYTCPHCGNFHKGPFKNLKSEYIDTGKVKFVYREVYFDRFGLWASMIARCGGADKFFGVTDLIYESQSEWSQAGEASAIVDELRKIGRVAGLGQDQLEACLQDGEKAQALVSWYQENAEMHDITGTPSFVINGKKVSNQSWDSFKALIEEELGN